MKKVVLLGDSIRMGYEATVRAELEGVAEVWSPEENGQHTVNQLVQFWQWVPQQRPDILHLNAGLWDCRHVLQGGEGNGGNLVPIDHYRANVRRWLELCQQHTNAKIIWATSTPINTAKNLAFHSATENPGRIAEDVLRYNAVAVEEAQSLGIEINDLHSFVLANNADEMRTEDGVHYTAAGSELLGKQVASVIRAHL